VQLIDLIRQGITGQLASGILDKIVPSAAASTLPVETEQMAEPAVQTYPYQNQPTQNPLPQMQMPTPANPSGDVGIPQPTGISQATPQRLPDIEMQAPEGVDPEKWAKAPPEVKAKGQQADEAIKVLSQAEGQDDSWFEGFGSRVGDFFGNKENMLGLALAFNSLRFQPDQGLAAVLGKQLESVQTTSQRNKTAQMLLKSSDPKQKKMGQLMLAGMSYKDAVASMKQTDFDKKWELAGGDAKKYKEMFGGSMVNIEAAEKAEDVKRAELFAKRMSDMAEGRTSAVDAKASVEALMILGENPDLNAIPNLLRGFIPRGVNAGVDAYKAAMVGVAQAQRQKGTGAQDTRRARRSSS
jgi:hypothetical protein